MKSFSDSLLVQNYLDFREPKYFDELYMRYANKVFYKSYSILNDRIKAEDATQDIFMKILLNLSKFTGKSSFSTWLYSITYNYCIDEIRRLKKSRIISVNDDYGFDIEDEVDDLGIHEEDAIALRSTLDVIDETDRILLLMKYQDNMMLRDIAETLKLSESAVKMRLQRAKARFKKKYLMFRKL